MTQSQTTAAPSGEPASAPTSRRPRFWRPRITAATALLVAGSAGAWWLFWASPVVSEGGFGVTVHDVQPGRPYLVSVNTLCLDGVRTAALDDVTVPRGGLTVTDFAVRPRLGPPSLGMGSGAEGSLADAGFGDARSFSGQCDDEAYTELAVELSRNDVGPAHTERLDVHWSAGLRSGVVSVPVTVTFCPPGDATELCAGGS